MSVPDLYIEAGWVVERVGYHTCGTGRDGYYGAHEPGCGSVPVMPAWQWFTFVASSPLRG